MSEKEFRKQNKDIFILEDFAQVLREYANLPMYLRRYCVYREKERRLKI